MWIPGDRWLAQPDIANADYQFFALNEGPTLERCKSSSRYGGEARDDKREAMKWFEFLEPIYGPVYRTNPLWGMAHDVRGLLAA